MNNNQTIQRRPTLAVSTCTLALSLCLVTSCRAQGISDEEHQWLIDKTKEDLVFVEGGTFMMGDVGYIDENGREQLFSGDPETLPVHKVTLDSYSMQRYEVSIKEFDIYTKAIGEDRI
ncbi:sulfatase, partial [Marinilabiliaceae bacterium JC017]